MLEQLLDSGAVGPEELDSLKQMMESQMGTPCGLEPSPSPSPSPSP